MSGIYRVELKYQGREDYGTRSTCTHHDRTTGTFREEGESR